MAQGSAPPPLGDWEVDSPPPPDNFPADWEQTWQPSFDAAKLAAQPEPKFKKDEPVSLPPETVPASIPDEDEHRETETPALADLTAAIPGVSVQAVEQPVRTTLRLPSLYVPVAQTEDRAHPPQQITILLRPTGDRERDKRRIKTLYGTLISFHGHDRFSFQIHEGGRGHLIDFPNDTTRVCPEMLLRLKKLMREESWQIEEITLQ